MKWLLPLALASNLGVAIAADMPLPMAAEMPVKKFPPPPSDWQHETAVQVYAHALEVNIFVESNCPELKVNTALLDKLGAWAHLRADRDIDLMIKERQTIVNLFNEKKDLVGKELWCWGIKNYYGPQGNVIKDLVYQ
jgi:hypothetical protein